MVFSSRSMNIATVHSGSGMKTAQCCGKLLMAASEDAETRDKQPMPWRLMPPQSPSMQWNQYLGMYGSD